MPCVLLMNNFFLLVLLLCGSINAFEFIYTVVLNPPYHNLKQIQETAVHDLLAASTTVQMSVSSLVYICSCEAHCTVLLVFAVRINLLCRP